MKTKIVTTSASPLPLVMAALLSAAVLLVYVFTLFPTVPPGDSGELIVQSYLLGVVHPPGYPLYTMLAKVFTLLPWGSVAWRVNFLSACCDSMAVMFLFLAVYRLTKSIWASAVPAALFACSSIVWNYAVVAEVFALNNFFVAALLYLSVRYSQEERFTVAVIISFVMGLALSNHHTIIFLVLPLFVWLLSRGGKPLWKRSWLLILAGAAGLLPYAYLWFAAQKTVPGSWGETGTLEGFWKHISRKEYGTFSLIAEAGPTTDLLDYLEAYTRSLFVESLYLGPALALVGVIAAFRDSKKTKSVVTVWVVGFVLYLIVFHSLANIPLNSGVGLAILSRFWQQSNLLVFAAIGLALATVEKAPFFRSPVPRVSLVIFGIAAIVVQVSLNYRAADNHNNFTFANMGRAILSPLPPQSFILLVGNDTVGAVSYLQHCEGVRPDVQITDLFWLDTDWYSNKHRMLTSSTQIPGPRYLPGHPDGYNLKQLFDANLTSHPMFMSYYPPDTREASDSSSEHDYIVWPYGLINKVFTTAAAFDVDAYLKDSDIFYSAMDIKAIEPFKNHPWENHLLRLYRETQFQRSFALISRGMTDTPISERLVTAGVVSLQDLIARDAAPDDNWFQVLAQGQHRLAQLNPNASLGRTPTPIQ